MKWEQVRAPGSAPKIIGVPFDRPRYVPLWVFGAVLIALFIGILTVAIAAYKKPVPVMPVVNTPSSGPTIAPGTREVHTPHAVIYFPPPAER